MISSRLLHHIEYIMQQENHSTTMEDKNKGSNNYDFGVYGENIANEEHEEIKVKALNRDIRTLLSSKFGIVHDQLQVASVLNKTVFCSLGDVVKDINKEKGVPVCSDEDEGSIQVYRTLDGSRGKNFEPCSGENFVPTNSSMMELIESRRDVWFHHIFSGEVDRKLEDKRRVIVIFGQHLSPIYGSPIFGSLDTLTWEGNWGQQSLTDCLGMEEVKGSEQAMNVGDLNNVWEIRALKRKPRTEEATKLLEKIAKQVQPIMRKHKWRVKLLSEFCPSYPSLLGLNVGAGIHVKLRLRRPNRDTDFYPFDQVLDTMLHELCHNAHGHHNGNFYKLWDELRKECEELMSKEIIGIEGGFDLPGRRLGGYSWQPPLSSLRKTALTAVEKRSQLGSLLPSRPKRVGGDSFIKEALTPVQAAAMAAERRLHDDIWCGSQSCEHSDLEEANGETVENPIHSSKNVGSSRLRENSTLPLDQIYRKKSRVMDSSFLAQPSGTPKFVDLTMDTPQIGSSNQHQTSSKGRSIGLESISHPHSDFQAGSSSENFPRPHVPLSGDTRTLYSEEPAMWKCSMCTMLNKTLAPTCELCGTQQPKDVATKYSTWSCKFCTLENNVKLDKCSACDQWRYSLGPPVSTRTPNLGT